MDAGSLKQLLEQGLSAKQIAGRFGRSEKDVRAWLARHGLAPDGAARRPTLSRADLERFVEDGASVSRIASERGVSETTVRYWLRKFGLRTPRSVRRGTARAAKAAGLATTQLRCAHHGLTPFFLEGRGYYRCKRCRQEAVARRRRRTKAILVAEAGGCCVVCGYDRCVRALTFHHLHPENKRFSLASMGVTRGIATLRDEARKCVLLCANCHAEVESGVAAIESAPLPATVGPADPG